MTPDTQFEEDDWRRSLTAFGQPLFKGDTFLQNLKKVEALKSIASEKGMTVAQLALAWVISNPAVSVALVGTRRAAEMEENSIAAEWGNERARTRRHSRRGHRQTVRLPSSVWARELIANVTLWRAVCVKFLSSHVKASNVIRYGEINQKRITSLRHAESRSRILCRPASHAANTSRRSPW